MTQTFSQQTWASAFLAAIGNASPSTSIRNFVMGWEKEEGGGIANACQYNALNTTLPMPDATSCNSIGVKSYTSFQEGVGANALTLQQGYPSLLQALRTNDSNALGLGNGPVSNGVAQDLSKWVSGSPTPIDTSYINNIEKLAGGNTQGGTSPTSAPCSNTTDICLCCGSQGSTAYTQCLAQVAIGVIPQCAQNSYNNQSPTNNLQNIGTSIQNAILGPIEQFLPTYLMKAGLFVFALILVIFGFTILRS